MEVGVLLVSLALVFITSFLISVLGTSVFFSLLSLSAVFAGFLFYTGNAASVMKKISAIR